MSSQTVYSPLFIIIVLVIQVVIAFGCGKLAEGGGHSFWLGFLLGFFCGLIGLLICIALYFSGGGPRRRAEPLPPVEMYRDPYDYYPQAQEYGLPSPPPPPDDAFEQGVVACPQCRSAVPRNEQFCWNCGSAVAPVAPGGGKVCPLCQGKNAPDAAHCKQCGSELGTSW